MNRLRVPIVIALALLGALHHADARPPRSAQVRAEFQRLHPCPATASPRGACPGWQVDHITPLKCGGADTPANMQWLTVEEHKLKTKREARLCRKKA